jgi:site-specific DNA-methyltransferase (cytosine-N4-specific)
VEHATWEKTAKECRASRFAGKTVKEQLASVNWDFPDSNNGTDGIQAIHPYPAKFIPEIPRTLIDILGVQPGTAVFDPFCGCGTTLLEAQRFGFASVGVDVNPIACLISRVKTSPCPSGLEDAAERCAESARANKSPAIPSIPNLDHWFPRSVQRGIAALIHAITQVSNASIREYLRLAVSSIVVRVSNQDSDTRYAAVEKNVSCEQVVSLFLAACKRILACKPAAPFPTAHAGVIEHDTLTLSPSAIGMPISLVVTSPPYPNAYEYWLYHKYRMWWLGSDPLKVKAQEIGARAHFFKKNHATSRDFEEQMRRVFCLVMEVLVRHGYFCMVVGRSRIHGRDVDNAACVSGLAKSFGLKEAFTATRTISATRKSFNLSHARIKTESVLVFYRQ